ncbi:branched-chain amino acid transport system ATP-binding protein [Mesorhizobium sp. YL-MeA3-2017]|nr:MULTISPECIES: ABC transporter ATP-binding protein [Mesorhizobium]MBN9235700.1 ABC transporter ATP-binding protein [Mesorhizobium sp.]MDQ0332962.1 branched-chain amino acid transport system ATP-binding protein [Mesorhizobium sp. YL-MeA3-2017]
MQAQARVGAVMTNSSNVGRILSVEGLTKRYGAMAAVSDLTFAVRPGEVLGIGGPNGAGKTTLFDTISGVSRPTAGRVVFDGHDISSHSAPQICHLGIGRTFQLNAVFETMTVRENLQSCAYFGTRKRIIPWLRFDRQAEEQADEAMEVTGLQDLAETRASKLPILQRKLLMTACAIASRPKLLLLDEPVGGLNANEIDLCAKVFRRLRDFHGMTIVLIEHIMSFMVALSDNILILHHGRKLYEGPATGLAEDREVVEVYLGAAGATAVKAAANERQA